MMLQDMIGEEAFLEGLRGFFETFKFQSARTTNFIAAMEKASGRDLRNFFRNWFNSYELPDVRTSVTSEKTENGYLLKIRISQIQQRFEFPLWIEWKSDGETKRHMVMVTESVQDFAIPTAGKPDAVRINPLRAVPGRFN
jgi:aminopeptidase N